MEERKPRSQFHPEGQRGRIFIVKSLHHEDEAATGDGDVDDDDSSGLGVLNTPLGPSCRSNEGDTIRPG